MSRSNNVLMISYYFPPYAGVSVVRVKKHCKYLPGKNWHPWVFSVDPRYYKKSIIDDMEDVRGSRIYRVPYLNVPGAVFLVKLFYPLFVAAYVLKNKSALNAVYLTGSPFHPFLLTGLIAGILKIPAILDFRDSWSFNHGYDGHTAESRLEKFKEYLLKPIERFSIRFATRVIFSTAFLQKEYANLYPEYNDKFITITNGFDPDDIADIQPKHIVKEKSLILTGKFKLYTPEVVYGLFEVLKSLKQIKFIYIGSEDKEILDLAKSYGVDDKVTTLPYQTHAESLSLIAGADYTMMTNGMKNGTGTKIFDYLSLNKPIICFVPKGSIIKHQFVNIENVVIMESPHSPASIRQGLEKLFSIKPNQPDNLIRSYSREVASQQLADILNEVTERKQ